MTEMHVDHQSSRLNHRAIGRSGVVMGMAVLIACMAFFGFDVVADVFDHALGRTPYALGELVHLIFEILAVIGLGYAAATLRAYLRLLQTQAASSRDTRLVAKIRLCFYWNKRNVFEVCEKLCNRTMVGAIGIYYGEHSVSRYCGNILCGND